jgi:type II secretory pathway component GspD/PulD (secretin)
MEFDMQSVSLKRTGQWKRWFMPLVFCVLLLTGVGAAAELDTESGVLRSRVYSFKHISSQQAQALFSELHIGKKYNALTPEILIVTSDVGSDLVKATAIAGILDQTPAPKIEILTADSQSPPKPEAFMAALKSITVGTMTDAPPKGSPNPAIIDVLDHKLIAIASEGTLNEIKAAFQAWEKENQPSIPENAAAAPLTETVVEPNLPPIRPVVIEPAEAPMEPNLLALVPEPNALARPAAEIPASTEPLESIASQLFETPSMDEGIFPGEAEPAELTELNTEPNESAAQTPAESAEDFLSEGLLQELADAGQKAEIEQAPEETTVAEAAEAILPEPTETQPAAADANEPPREETSEDESIKMLQALMAQAGAEKEQIAEQEAPEQPAEAGRVQTAEPARETDPTQSEIEQLRQKLAELEAESAAAGTPFPEPAAESKIQAPHAVRAEPQIAPKLAEEELETVMDLPQEVELESLVDLVGKQLGLNYMYDPTILKNQRVQLKVHGGKIKVKDIYSLLESVLKLKGFVMTRENQLVTIVKAANAADVYKQVDPVIRTPGEPIEAGNIIVSTLFQLTNISTDAAKKMLLSLNLGMTNGFQEIPETGTLLVTDYAYRMGRIEEVLAIIDIPGEKKEYKFRTLKYMAPSKMVPKLQELASELQDVSLQISTPAAASDASQTRSVTTRDPKTGRTVVTQVPINVPPSAAQQTPDSDAVFIDTDDRTNRILMAGKPDQIALVNELIDALDVPQYDLRFVREYLIQNVEAQDVIDVINELGLASVSEAAASTTSAASRRTPIPVRVSPGQPVQPQVSASTPQTADSADQPYISIRAASNSLLVNGTAEQHKAIELVIAHVDIVQKDQRTIRQYEIQFVDTQEIMNTLTDLGIIAPQTASAYDSYGRTSGTDPRSRSASMTARTAQPGQPEVAEGAALSLPTAEGGSEKDITAEQPQISVLEATNSLLVYATPRQHDAIALVIAHADHVPEQTTTPYVVYALENQDPLELSDVLTKLIQETVEEEAKTSTPESKIQTGGAASTTAKLPTLEEEKIRVIPDEMSYSLIVYANKRNQQWISELIRELDEYRPQVLLDCTLVVINKDESFKYDLDIVTKTYNDLSLRTPSPLTTISGNFSEQSYGEARSTSGNFTGFFNSDMVQALLTAVQTKDYGRVMARPKILVNDNQEGEIKTQNTTSIAQQKSIIQPGTETSTSITTTDVSFAEYSEGVTLKIKPHISKGDMLRLEITLGRSDFTLQPSVLVAGAVYPRPPDILSTDVTTVATVPDGTTIILGGLEGVDQQKKTTKVPIMGDLPIVGGLFRGIDDLGNQSKLYVFVKANVLRPSDQLEGLEDIRRVSGKNREAFEDMERKFQEHQDWPGIKPKPMDPEKVLEDDEYLQGIQSKLEEMDQEKAM